MEKNEGRKLKFTELLKSEQGFVEKPIGLHAEGIVSIHMRRLDRGGQVIVGEGPLERDVTRVLTVVGQQVDLVEDFDTVFNAWQGPQL